MFSRCIINLLLWLDHNMIRHVGSVTTICVGKYMRLKYSEGKEVSMFQLQFHWIGNRGSHLALRSTSIFDGLKSSTEVFYPRCRRKSARPARNCATSLYAVQLRYMDFFKTCPAFFINAKLIKE